jgi:hypothetical protein
MSRFDNFTLRVSTTERELIAAVARRLERNESDTVRLLVREKARELGVIAQTTDRAPARSEAALALSTPA